MGGGVDYSQNTTSEILTENPETKVLICVKYQQQQQQKQFPCFAMKERENRSVGRDGLRQMKRTPRH